jgi:gamma-glutamylcyclotransferase (GGCT)/AIG2-like uncharacterized protein YtfP
MSQPGDADTTVVAVYGTLRRGERNEGLLAGATWLGTGRIQGRLHVVRTEQIRPYPYPCLLPPSAATDPATIHVELYAVDGLTLATLDALEGYDPADDAGSEYVRRVVDVDDGPVGTASVYRYNGAQADIADAIPDGDWVTWRRGDAG